MQPSNNRQEKNRGDICRPTSLKHQVYYPVFLNLEDRKCVVIGGGKIAERKVMGLLGADADVTLISPDCTLRLRREIAKGRLKYLSRKYRKGDVRNAFLVVAATSQPEINNRISRDAAGLVNIVDCPSLCNFIMPSVVRRGPLVIAISTSGVSPAMSKAIRKDIGRHYDSDFTKHLVSVGKMRQSGLKEVRSSKSRARILNKFAGDSLDKYFAEKTR